MSRFLVISNTKEMFRLPCDNIVYVAGGRDYSDIHMSNKKIHTVTLQLGQIEDLLADLFAAEQESPFARIGKSLIINMDYLTYINPSKKQLTLSNYQDIDITLEASRDALLALKSHFDK